MMRGEDRAEASLALSLPIIPQCNSKDISLLTTGDRHFPMKINMLYFPHTLENTHTPTPTHTHEHLHWHEFEWIRMPTNTPAIPPTTCRHLRCVLSKCSINAQHGVCVLYCRIIWHAIKTDFNALQPTLPSPAFAFRHHVCVRGLLEQTVLQCKSMRCALISQFAFQLI